MESKSQAEDWRRHLTKAPTTRTSGRTRNDASSALEGDGEAEEEFEVPDLGASDLDWGDPDHVSEVEIRPDVKASPVFASKASFSTGAIPRNTSRLMMGKK